MTKKYWFFIALILTTFLVRDNSFFWDTVQLASKQGHYIYETAFQSLILPNEIDSGHPPLFGAYLAAVWKVFGKTLPVSHFAMIPFLLGIVHFLFRIGGKLLGPKQAPWLCLLCFADPVLASQSVLVSPDIVLVCFFLMAIWAVYERKPIGICISILVLSLISMRGMMLCTAVLAFSVITMQGSRSKGQLVKHIAPFLPGILIAFAFLAYHWQETGWIGHHPASIWAPSFELVGGAGFAKNILVLGWRCLDFGRVFVWLALIPLVFFWYRKKRTTATKPKWDSSDLGWQLTALTILVFLAIVPIQLFYKGLLAHRYFLPFFLCLNMSTLYLINRFSAEFTNSRFFKFVKPLLAIGLVTGNLWVYPGNISMGWDSTLAHLPWYGLQKKANQYLQSNSIPFEKVGTAFPNIGPREVHELNGETQGFVEKDFEKNCFVYYSNIMNDFTDDEVALLRSKWEPVFTQEMGGVEVVLYQNPNLAPCEN